MLPQLLSQQDISIRELARRTGITYTTIRAVVHGQRRSVQLDVLEAICRTLAVQPGDIYSIESENAMPEGTTERVQLPTSARERKRARVRSRSRGAVDPKAVTQKRKTTGDWRTW